MTARTLLAPRLSFTPLAMRGAAAVIILALSGCGGSNTSTPRPPPSIYTLGGKITGLNPASGLALTNNGADATTILAGATTFNMTTAVPYGPAYKVQVSGRPHGYICQVASGGSGTMPAKAVTAVTIICQQQLFPSVPQGAAVDASGNVYLADSFNNAVKEILQGTGTVVQLP